MPVDKNGSVKVLPDPPPPPPPPRSDSTTLPWSLGHTLHFGDDIDCNTCPHPGVPRVESHLFTVGGILGNSKGMAWKTESMQNMGV